ncbi:prolipoprotein diacylglyceryl transferase [Cellulomonas dongxiuzhuiae]|uniref:Phosphatidylglycerol--prolipoprotein diacylglyceryl transferase n=1 Tax=Cellulomonas dongxiuzhuiae TaxID=2819979 RepID=A0ABX8GKL9_9CELL|nr:prolipoprotein diacylglyceryl transferase [Cellulomonas dongxiuzhuiae]MBO3089976.1 prolipoprotein diacylglyceryl transferase [Cellulomonas dongxiuzhuiae]MBO3095517.1 prolipoprotein diacylglyceryl transferase [Cellulomonas dongxiuzhuiae]QWC16495.1 prolipoprotein diacylglyceryl transferase [Cellulomonas dongxiuzhuiae]
MHLAIPSPDLAWSGLDLGPLTLHTYALCLLAGMAAAVWLTSRRLTARGGPPGVVLDIAIWAVPCGIVGARIYHVLTHWGDYVGPGKNLLEVLYVWEGGIAILGSLIGGAVGAAIGCRRAGVRLWSFADALAPAMLLAQAIGRLGNWFNHELFGSPTTLPWGLEIPASNGAFPPGLPADTLFHPLFLYEMLWNLLGIAVILLLERRVALRWGTAFGVYLIWYGTARVWLELLRIDPSSVTPLGLPANVWGALVAVLTGLTIIVVQRRRHPEPETSVMRDGSTAPVDEPVEDRA